MAKKNIVSIEDRIPNLKQARKKKARRRLIFYVGLFAVLIFSIVYLQSPLSNVQRITIKGNSTIEEETIKDWSGISSENNFWSVNNQKIIKSISSHQQIEDVTVSKKFFSTIEINVKEFERIGYLYKEEKYLPVLENGVILTENPLMHASSDAPLLIGFENNEYLTEMAGELQKLPKKISGIISEVSWQPTEDNPFKISLFMSDGYRVDGSIRNFSDNMKIYPSIVAQLDPTVKGVIHIGVGAYFEAESADKKEAGEEETPPSDEDSGEELAVNDEED